MPQSSSIPQSKLLPLQVDSLSFEAAGKALLTNVSFALHAGRPTCVVGPNGAGKSLLLRLCHGLLMPSGGSIRWAGGTADQHRRAQAMVFQRQAGVQNVCLTGFAPSSPFRQAIV